MLSFVGGYYESELDIIFVTDIESWKMKITDVDGKACEWKGSMCGGIEVAGTNIEKCITEIIPVDSLAVDGLH